ncbi:hypothetical protein BTH42_31475 [Burkholderia sp. SRS-W-2-2016]|nr:hypothetical protein BTH42_31475 [Burkholderia sp. SRS-W-2-2016]
MASPSVVPSRIGVAAASVGVVAVAPEAGVGLDAGVGLEAGVGLDAGVAPAAPFAPVSPGELPPPPPPQPAIINTRPTATNRDPSRSSISYSVP